MTLRILVGSVLLSSLVHGVAWACSCIDSGGWTEDALAGHDLVVYGEVLSVRRPVLGCGGGSSMDPVNVRIEVIEAFVGAEDGEVVTVTTASSGASCGIDFVEGQQWVVFAAGEDLSAGLCGPSELTRADDPRLDDLRALAEGSAR